jgi:hypothetical protein
MTFRGILSSLLVTYYYVWLLMGLAYRRKCLRIERRLRNRERRMENFNELIRESDIKCIVSFVWIEELSLFCVRCLEMLVG